MELGFAPNPRISRLTFHSLPLTTHLEELLVAIDQQVRERARGRLAIIEGQQRGQFQEIARAVEHVHPNLSEEIISIRPSVGD